MKFFSLVGFLAFALPLSAAPQAPVGVAAKKFTESVLLSRAVEQLLELEGLEVENRGELGGTRILWNALLAGEIDVYPEYTGTILHEILAEEKLSSWPEARAHLESLGLRATESIGFENNYALGVTRALHERLGLQTVSDLNAHPNLRFGLGGEFMDREDGWKGLRRHYALPQTNVEGLDHDLAYRALQAGQIDLMDLYRTDAEIEAYDLVTLEDDQSYFPSYSALLVYRADLAERAPEAVAALHRLEGKIDAATMVRANARAKIEGLPEHTVAALLLEDALRLDAASAPGDPPSRAERIAKRSVEQLWLVMTSLLAAIALGIPLGIAAVRYRLAAPWILGACGLFWTIPSLALFVFLIPFLGIGGPPAILALFLYSLLPIVRNTAQGLRAIEPELLESADALGLSSGYRLRKIELPLASPAILAGIKIAAVICVGTATLGALIGAGGYGQPILTGIRLADTSLMLEGALPSAAMAILVLGLFEVAERRLVPKGLRLPRR